MNTDDITEITKNTTSLVNNFIENILKIMNQSPKRAGKATEAEMTKKAKLLGLTPEEYTNFKRFDTLEKLKQSNNLKIVQLAKELSDITAEKLHLVQPDWLHKWIDFSSFVSDEDVQILWAKILAGEITNPGSFSLSTLNILNLIDKRIANNIMDFFHHIVKIINYNGERNLCAVYPSSKLYSKELLELESLGLIKITSTPNGLNFEKSVEKVELQIFDRIVSINPVNNKLIYRFYLGNILFTSSFYELYKLNDNEFSEIIFNEIIHELEQLYNENTQLQIKF